MMDGFLLACLILACVFICIYAAQKYEGGGDNQRVKQEPVGIEQRRESVRQANIKLNSLDYFDDDYLPPTVGRHE